MKKQTHVKPKRKRKHRTRASGDKLVSPKARKGSSLERRVRRRTTAVSDFKKALYEEIADCWAAKRGKKRRKTSTQKKTARRLFQQKLAKLEVLQSAEGEA